MFAIFVGMNKFLLSFFALSLPFLGSSQEHIQWSGKYDVQAKMVLLTADLEAGWHLYSQSTDESVGPIATKFELDKNKLMLIEGPMSEPESIDAFDPNFEGNVKYFEKQVVFKQRISPIEESTSVTYTITYMICNKEMCLPPVDKIITLTITK
jgi:hypothetical protein